jgi:hypothetical protein
LSDLPRHDPNIPKQEQGLYQKFSVSRTDGSSGLGGKHEDCDYFVLDLSHDPHAYRALKAYIESCRGEFPALADDLTTRLIRMRRGGLGAEKER